jgi:nucleoside-diphosphate-sugar epimerase
MTIFGNGFIAKNLKKLNLPNKFFIYAAGVSNSNIKQNKFYLREIKQFNIIKKKINSEKIFVYISSLSVENKSLKHDKYVKNKLIIESIIKKEVKNYIIIRLPQVVGKNRNKYTITNFIYNTVKEGKKFYLWENSKRNLIDIDDVSKIIKKYLLDKPKINSVINIFNPNSITVKDLLKIFSKILSKKIILKVLKKKNKNINLKSLKKNTFLPNKYYDNMKNNSYIKKILIKYYK